MGEGEEREFPRAGEGFDFVVGNPPYVANRSLSVALKTHVRCHYQTAHGHYDLVVPFTEAGLRMLRPGGELAYLASNKFLAADYGEWLRRYAQP